MTTRRDVLRVIISTGIGISTAYRTSKVIMEETNMNTGLAVLTGAGVGAGIGYLYHFLGKTLGTAIREWLDGQI